MSYPILYSLQHCPYAMRARLGMVLAEQSVWLRAIVLKNKPKEMLEVSPKGTVPVLVLANNLLEDENVEHTNYRVRRVKDYGVIDESLDIMLWALTKNDPQNLLYSHQPQILPEMLSLIVYFDHDFTEKLDKYKSAKRYHDNDKDTYRHACENDIVRLEKRLSQHQYLMGDQLSLADYAVLSIIRKFSKVERQWYLNSPYPRLKGWLKSLIESAIFSKVMVKYPLWLAGNEELIFGYPNGLKKKPK